MSISAYDLLQELIQGGRVYEDYNGSWHRPRKKVYLVRHDGTKQVIQHSPLYPLLDHYIYSIKIGSRTEWRLRISQEIKIEGDKAHMFELPKP